MMKWETCASSPDFFAVVGLNALIINYIKYTINSKLRFFEDRKWHIHTSQVVKLTQLGYTEYGHVSYQVLPDALQLRIAKEKPSWKKRAKNPDISFSRKVSTAGAYKALYLIEDAPIDVVKAIYRYLSKKHHPDQGGDVEQFKRVQEAYEQLKE